MKPDLEITVPTEWEFYSPALGQKVIFMKLEFKILIIFLEN